MNQERAKQLGITIALAILGLGGGAAMRAWRISHGVGIEKAAGDGNSFARAKLSSQAASVWGKLLAALGMRGGRTFSTADLVSLLSGHQRDPAAMAFLGEFRSDPRLMELWQEYQNGGGNLDWLARKLSDSRAFTELVNRHADEPRFRGLAADLARDLESLLARRQGQNPPGDGLSLAGTARAYGALRRAGPVDGKGPLDWQPAVLASVGAAGMIQGGGPEAYAAPKAELPKDRKLKTQESLEGQVGREHDVAWKLKDTLVRAGPDRDIVRFLESLFATMPKYDRDALISLCADLGVCDPVAACSTSPQLWASCVQSCGANPKCTLQFPPERPGAEPVAACQEPDSDRCRSFCADHPGNLRCIELAAARLAGQIADACQEPRSGSCQSICSQHPANPACLDAAARALANNCTEDPAGEACRQGCRAGGQTLAAVCAQADRDALAQACRVWDGRCQALCSGRLRNASCAAALAAYITRVCVTSPNPGNCRFACSLSPVAAGCRPTPGSDTAGDDSVLPDGCIRGPAGGIICSHLAPTPTPAPNAGPPPQGGPCANPTSTACKNHCASPGANPNFCQNTTNKNN